MNLEIQKQQLIDDIQGRIYRIGCLLREAELRGIEALIGLADQEEQFGKMKKQLISIDTTLVKTKKNLNHLQRLRQRLFDLFCIPFHRLSERKKSSKLFFNSNKKQNLLSRGKHYPMPKMLEHNSTSSNTIDKETDEAIEEFEIVISRLKNMAVMEHAQLTRQDIIIKDIYEHVIKSKDSIETQNMISRKFV